MIKNKLSELHIWLGEHEKFVLILLFSFTFLYGITFDEIPKIVLLILIIPLTALEVIRVGKVYVDFREPLVFLGLSTFYIFWGVIVLQGQGFALLCLMLYILSKYIVLSHCNNDTKIIIYYLIFFSLMIFILGVLNYIPVFNGSAIDEIWPSFWKKEMWHRDQVDCYYIMFAGLPVYSIYLIIKKKKEGLILLLLSITGVIITMYGNGRGIAIIFGVTSFIVLAFLVVHNRKNRKVRLLFELLVGLGIMVSIIAYVVYSNNIMGLADVYKKSFWSGGGGLIHNVRFSLKKQQIELLFDYPFGKCNVEINEGANKFVPGYHVHDLWLDIARRGGLIPFTLVCTYSFVSTIDLIKVWKTDEVDEGLKILLTGVFYAVNLLCWVEPIIVMRKSFWGITYMLAGIFRGILIIQQKEDRAKRVV